MAMMMIPAPQPTGHNVKDEKEDNEDHRHHHGLNHDHYWMTHLGRRVPEGAHLVLEGAVAEARDVEGVAPGGLGRGCGVDKGVLARGGLDLRELLGGERQGSFFVFRL
jgi:hypothetical protein